MPTLNIGKCSDDPRKINKNFSGGSSVVVHVKEPCSLENPTFILNYSSDYTSCNYCYYADWGRYYYINDIVMAPGGKAEIYCTVDVLNTYKDDINKLSCYVSRIGDASKRAAYVNDPLFPVSTETYVTNLLFSASPFTVDASSGYQYLLTTIGRAAAIPIEGGGE